MTFHMSLRRKFAIATWSAPKEGNIYGKMCIDMGNALKYIEYLRATTEEKVTITHLVGRAAGLAFGQCPDLNGRIFFGRYYPHETVDMAFLVALDGGKDLAKFKICRLDEKTTATIAHDLRMGVERLRSGQDAEFESSQKLIKILPTFMVRWMLWLSGYFTSSMGINVGFLGLKKYPFGACIITSVGMFGVDEGFAPPTPFARVPVYLAIPEIKKRPMVVNDQIIIRPMLDLTATIDHRFMDGFRAAQVTKMIRNGLENPWTMDGISESEVLDALKPRRATPSDRQPDDKKFTEH
jgi:pyruvate/2-oxoglutarate dehydrogenase complex dihydrolipoamide acyltransferase (E2) component